MRVKIEPLLAAMLFWSGSLVLNMPVAAEPLIINTEEYAPLSFTENGVVKGIATEQVELLLQRAEVDYVLEVYPWARAYNTALTNANTCVFTTSNTPERANQFKWVEPLSLNKSILVKKKGATATASTLEEAKNFKIGIQNEDAAGVFLKSNGFTRLDQATDVDKSILKLKAGRIDFVAMAESRFNEMSANDNSLEKVMDVFSLKMGLACNLSVKDEVIAALQAELEKIIADGTQQQIIDKY